MGGPKAAIGNMRSHPADELQIIHCLLFLGVPTVPVTDLALGFQKRQPLQREKREASTMS